MLLLTSLLLSFPPFLSHFSLCLSIHLSLSHCPSPSPFLSIHLLFLPVSPSLSISLPLYFSLSLHLFIPPPPPPISPSLSFHSIPSSSVHCCWYFFSTGISGMYCKAVGHPPTPLRDRQGPKNETAVSLSHHCLSVCLSPSLPVLGQTNVSPPPPPPPPPLSPLLSLCASHLSPNSCPFF